MGNLNFGVIKTLTLLHTLVTDVLYTVCVVVRLALTFWKKSRI